MLDVRYVRRCTHRGVIDITADRVRLRVEMLGGFTIIDNGNKITEQARKSSKVWRLLQYLIANRYRLVSQEELLEVFCDEELQINPGSVLRTMVYRARGALEKSGLTCADSLIIAKSGSYSWNNNIECTTDTEEFEELIKQAGSEDMDPGEALELLLQAAALYKGDFLPNSSGDLWVLPLVRWYRTMYIGCVHDALDLLDGFGRNDEAEELCIKALLIDRFDERLIEHHLKALVSQDKREEALDVYRKMEEMFFDVLGVDFSENLRSLYSRIQHPDIEKDLTLDEQIENWMKDVDFPGAFYCDAGIFKTLFQIETRSVPRSGRTAFIVRFDTKHEPKKKDGGIMKQLGTAIPGCLRMGDLFTRCSPNQYMLMLYSLTYEDCKMLVNRILNAIDSRHLPNLKGTSIRHVKPVE